MNQGPIFIHTYYKYEQQLMIQWPKEFYKNGTDDLSSQQQYKWELFWNKAEVVWRILYKILIK